MSLKKNSISIILSLLMVVYGCSSTMKKNLAGKSSANESIDKSNSNAELNFSLNSDSDSKKAGKLQTVHFAFSSSGIDTDSERILLSNADFLRKYPSLKIQIEGHCDERGSEQFNLALGEKRAKEVESFFFGQGISAERMSVISMGKERPYSFGHDEESWRQSRRANFVITGK
ncbi:MAG: OmpA family protein [Bacteriovorax sp.]